MVQDAVIRNFEVIGEAAKRMPEQFRVVHAAIPWRLMAGFRDVLIHDYAGVDLERFWRIAQILPSLEQLEHEIAEETDNLDA